MYYGSLREECSLISVCWCGIIAYGFFFFQAEDGIRDLVRSRGLGDVYKRQEEGPVEGDVHDRAPGVGAHVLGGHREVRCGVVDPVSYTHLTLPTIYSV